MRKCTLFLSLLLGTFQLATPVHAVNYTGEAWLDWTSLHFTGIPVTMTGVWQGVATSVHRLNGGFDQDHKFASEWREETSTQSIPQVVRALSSVDGNRLYATVNMLGSGNGDASAGRQGNFTPIETGNVTISIDYTMQHIGVSSLLPSFAGTPLSQVALGIHGVGGSFFDRDSWRVSEDALRTGTLSMTREVQTGLSYSFTTSAQVSAWSGDAVPLPDMLWPTLVGLIGLAFYVERTRRKLACDDRGVRGS